jgi:hypothetical protein
MARTRSVKVGLAELCVILLDMFSFMVHGILSPYRHQSPLVHILMSSYSAVNEDIGEWRQNQIGQEQRMADGLQGSIMAGKMSYVTHPKIDTASQFDM